LHTAPGALALYSWSDRPNRWHYVLLPGDDSGPHDADDIIHSRGAVVGEAALKARLALLPAGQKVEWLNDGPLHLLNWPPRHTMEDIVRFARERRIDLRVFRLVYEDPKT
jgi:hypothetical protein